jgi:hypothetical protein
MSSLRRILSSRANGARSRGPVSPEGKKTSSLNALRHGLLSKCIVLANESRENFDALLAQHIQRFGPLDDVELGIVEEMVAAFWRLRRAWAIETRLHDDAVAAREHGDEIGRITAAFTDLASSPQLGLLHRYEARLHHIRQRALENILILRNTPPLPNEPTSAPAPGPTALPALPPPPLPNEPTSAPATGAGPRGKIQELMIPDLSLAIRLQSLDQRIAELEREIAALPRHIAGIERQLDQHLRRLEADRAALSGNQKERKKLEGEIQVQEQKVSRLKDQSQQARTNEQYHAFQHEIEYCQKEIRKFEDRVLDLMAESETLEQNVRAAEVSLKSEREQVEREKQEARRRTEADQRQLQECLNERQAAVAQMSPAVYAAYERIRKKRNGVAVAEAADGLCLACHLSLRPQFFQDVRRNEQVLYCESCGRILYFNPPVAVEDAAPGPDVLS